MGGGFFHSQSGGFRHGTRVDIGLGIWGDGQHGAVVLNGGGTSTLTFHTFYKSLHITNNTILAPDGFGIWVQGELRIDAGSSIRRDGNVGLDGDNTGVGGARIAENGWGAGGAGADSTTGAGGNAASEPDKLGGNGGDGGNGSGGVGGTGSVATVLSANQVKPFAFPHGVFPGAMSDDILQYAGGVGGGAGGGDGSLLGGGGGGGAAPIMICARVLVNNGVISAVGGDGGVGDPGGNCGGGGPGGGGVIITVARYRFGATPLVAEGTPGTGGGTGLDGTIAASSLGPGVLSEQTL